MKLLNLFMGLFKKKKAASDDLATKDEIKTDAAIIGDSIHHISISPEEQDNKTA